MIQKHFISKYSIVISNSFNFIIETNPPLFNKIPIIEKKKRKNERKKEKKQKQKSRCLENVGRILEASRLVKLLGSAPNAARDTGPRFLLTILTCIVFVSLHRIFARPKDLPLQKIFTIDFFPSSRFSPRFRLKIDFSPPNFPFFRSSANFSLLSILLRAIHQRSNDSPSNFPSSSRLYLNENRLDRLEIFLIFFFFIEFSILSISRFFTRFTNNRFFVQYFDYLHPPRLIFESCN